MFSTTLKVIASLGILLGAVVSYLNLSEVETIYRCDGTTRYSMDFVEEWSGKGQLPDVIENPYKPRTGYLKIKEFSKLVLLWSDDRHQIWWEVPNKTLMLWNDTRDLGQQLQLLSYDGNVEGTFSTISLALSFVTPNNEFTGACATSK